MFIHIVSVFQKLSHFLLNKHRAHQYKVVGIGLLVCLVSACSGYQAGGNRTVGEFTDDVGIQAAVKTALIRDKELNGLAINVEVRRSVVSLYGRIPSEYARKKALDHAKAVRGVQEVVDRLTLGSP